MLRSLLISALVVSLARPVGGPESAENLQVLRALMAERLVIMEGVAAFKWHEGLPVEDKDREARIVEDTIAKVGKAGIEPKLMEHVIAAQIEAAKMVQHALFQRWRAAGKSTPYESPDLEKGLRPKISRLSGEFIALFVATRDGLDGCLAEQILDPVPEELADFANAWAVAIEGVLSASPPCMVRQE